MAFKVPKQKPWDRERAEALAAEGLAFLAEDPDRLVRFLRESGMAPAELAERAGSGEMLAAVLEHLAGDESLLLVFAASRGVKPEAVVPALALLSGAGYERSI